MQEYLALFEGTLEEFIEREGATQEEFYAAIRDNQDSRDPGIKLFVTCLLASADYDSFFKVMVKVSCAALAAVYSCTITHVHCGYIIMALIFSQSCLEACCKPILSASIDVAV
jgi:The ARF-like 2 binding protein BART